MPVPPLFTVGVSVCNIAAYLPQAAHSLLHQTYRNFEAIVVIETSTDGSERICRELFAGDERFRLFERPRSGSVASGRNFALRHARGMYMVWLDGDDWLSEDALQTFAQLIEQYQMPDIVCGGTAFIEGADDCQQQTKQHFELLPPDRIIDGSTALQTMLATGYLMVWLRIYRRQFLLDHELFQIDRRLHEDDEWSPRVMFYAKRVLSHHFIHYFYRRRPDSLMTKKDLRTLAHHIDNVISFLDFWRDHDIPECVRHPLASFYADYLLRYWTDPKMENFSIAERFAEYRRLAADRERMTLFRTVVPFAGSSKRLALRFLPLAEIAWGFHVYHLLIRKLYFPLLVKFGPFLKKRA